MPVDLSLNFVTGETDLLEKDRTALRSMQLSFMAVEV